MAKTAARAVLVDTNVLVYATQVGRGGSSSPQHHAATAGMERVRASGASVWVSRQILREYLAVVTRPLGRSPVLPPDKAVADIRRFASIFLIAEDGPQVTERLLDLLIRFPTGGRQIHDANIVATMLVHGVPSLLTFNVVDFRRYAGLIDLEPV